VRVKVGPPTMVLYNDRAQVAIKELAARSVRRVPRPQLAIFRSVSLVVLASSIQPRTNDVEPGRLVVVGEAVAGGTVK